MAEVGERLLAGVKKVIKMHNLRVKLSKNTFNLKKSYGARNGNRVLA